MRMNDDDSSVIDDGDGVGNGDHHGNVGEDSEGQDHKVVENDYKDDGVRLSPCRCAQPVEGGAGRG